jgi:hypothetical protein
LLLLLRLARELSATLCWRLQQLLPPHQRLQLSLHFIFMQRLRMQPRLQRPNVRVARRRRLRRLLLLFLVEILQQLVQVLILLRHRATFRRLRFFAGGSNVVCIFARGSNVVCICFDRGIRKNWKRLDHRACD